MKKAFDDCGISYSIKDLLADQGVKEAPRQRILRSSVTSGLGKKSIYHRGRVGLSGVVRTFA